MYQRLPLLVREVSYFHDNTTLFYYLFISNVPDTIYNDQKKIKGRPEERIIFLKIKIGPFTGGSYLLRV